MRELRLPLSLKATACGDRHLGFAAAVERATAHAQDVFPAPVAHYVLYAAAD